MPSIDSWKKDTENLLSDIDEYKKNPRLANPYKLLSGLARMIATVAGVLLPQTQALKWIIIGLKGVGGFLKGYSEKRK